MPLSAGERLGPYEILASIGEGGMGEVWRARDTRLDRIVALKVSKAQFSERFEREARSIAALNHPHICQLYDVVISKDAPNYLVMEFVEGSPLKGPLPLEQALRFAAQICEALDAAHRKGITHRDLKPANIIVTKQGVKLLDFGLAHVAPGENDVTLTVKGTVMGTPAYMAPEQWEGKPADARSDIYAFGCVLYEMLTGKHAAQERLPVEPAPLESILRTCLEKDPEDRWQSARDLRRALMLPAPSAATPSRRWWIPAAVALVIGALGGWAIAHFRQSPADERAFRLQIDPPEGGQFVYGNNSGGIALSPDGRNAAYVAAANGKTALWVRSLDAASGRPLAGTEGAYYPFWSPDGKSIGFFAAGKVQRVDLAGGAPLTICDVPGSNGRGAAWTGDGRIVLGSLAGLFQVPASGGTASPLTKIDATHGEGSHRWPQLLPGGRFLYWARSGSSEDNGVYAASFAKPGERVRLVNTDAAAFYAPGGDRKSYLLWTRGGTLVARELDVTSLRLAGEPHPVADPVGKISLIGGTNAAVSANGVLLYGSANTSSRFSWLDRTGKLLGGVGEPGEYGAFRLSADGRRAAIARDAPGGADLWLLEVQRGVSGRLTFHPGTNAYPVWSPDGRTILFGSTGAQTGAQNLFRKESSGAGNEQRLSQSPNVQDPTDWSGDGRWALYHEVAPETGFDLWALPTTPDGKPTGQAKPYLRTPFNESWGRFSPEPSPRWVAYQSDESGRNEVYIQAFPEPRGKLRISTGGGQYPQWGPGGRDLFYVSPDFKLMAVGLKLGADSVEPSTPRELFLLPTVDNGFSPYDTAPDGLRFLVRATPQQQVSQPLTVIVNWPALLKQGAAAQ
jgi:Tol biopolymer transport system component